MPESGPLKDFNLRHLRLTPSARVSALAPDVKELDAILITATTGDGQAGSGDAILIEGMTPETIEQGWMIACKLSEVSVGMTAEEAIGLYRRSHRVAPYTITALVVAVELAAKMPGEAMSGGKISGEVPLVGLLDSTDAETLEASILANLSQGHGTLRLTLSGDVARDRTLIETARRQINGAAALRIDGNQAFSPEAAVALVTGLDSTGIDWLAQPCVAGDWEAAAAVKQAATMPMAVAGFLFGVEDIEIAVEMDAATHIGLQFRQLGGFEGCARAVRCAQDHGLIPILGSSFQTDNMAAVEIAAILSNDQIISDVWAIGISEESILAHGIMALDARVLLDIDAVPELSEETLQACTVQELSFSR